MTLLRTSIRVGIVLLLIFFVVLISWSLMRDSAWPLGEEVVRAEAFIVSEKTDAQKLETYLETAESNGDEVYIVLMGETPRNIRGIVASYWHLGDSIQLDTGKSLKEASTTLETLVKGKTGVEPRIIYKGSP